MYSLRRCKEKKIGEVKGRKETRKKTGVKVIRKEGTKWRVGGRREEGDIEGN